MAYGKRQLGPLTPRGHATKLRIAEAAAALVYEKGAERVSLDEVMEASGTSKSQVYHYFANKEELVREVIELQTRRIVHTNADHLDRLESFDGLRAWRDTVVAAFRTHGTVGGCPLGSLTDEFAAQSDELRIVLDRSFEAWSAVIGKGLSRMQDSGHIKASADPNALAVAVLAAIQGGILLSKAARKSEPLELALDMALGHVESCANR